MSSATRAAAPALPPTVTRPRISVPEHREEPPVRVVDRRRVGAVAATSPYLFSRFIPRDPDVVEHDAAVVDTGQAALVVAVRRGDAGQVVALVVADRDQHAVHTVVDRLAVPAVISCAKTAAMVAVSAAPPM